jgi:hypothetical protein
MDYSAIFLGTILCLGIVTSREDIKFGKIRNIWIVAGLFLGLLFYLNLFFLGMVHYGAICKNLLFSIFVSYFLWKNKFWNPGDAKLFIIYTLLTPPEIYSKVYFFSFLSFNLLINTFVPATIFLIFSALINFVREKKYLNVTRPEKISVYFKKLSVGKTSLFRNIIGFTFLFIFFRLLRDKVMEMGVHYFPDAKTFFIALFIFYRPFKKIFKLKKIYIIFLLSLLFVALWPQISENPKKIFSFFFSYIKISLILILLSDFVRNITNAHIRESNEKTMPFAFWIFLGVLITWFIPMDFMAYLSRVLYFRF